MRIQGPTPATGDYLSRLVELAGSTEQFLSVYVSTNPAEITTEGIRLRINALLDQQSQRLAGTALEKPFSEERKVVEEFTRGIRPGSPGLVIISSTQAGEGHAVWLPDLLEEHVRFGPGADVLPLIDVLDDYEPVAVAIVERDKARLMVFAWGALELSQHLDTPLPDRDTTRGRVSPRLQRADLTREAGGGGALGFERHMQTHIEDHLRRVIHELEVLQQGYTFNRLFLAGPADALAMLKRHLSEPLKGMVVGDLTVDSRSSDQEVQALVMEAARRIERQNESDLVEEIITRSEKEQGAVSGTASTLWALFRRQLHTLVLAGGMRENGNHCPNCDLLLPIEDIVCPQCDQKTVEVDLWEELPRFAMKQGTPVEVVHGDAASALWHHEGMGGRLKSAGRLPSGGG